MFHVGRFDPNAVAKAKKPAAAAAGVSGAKKKKRANDDDDGKQSTRRTKTVKKDDAHDVSADTEVSKNTTTMHHIADGDKGGHDTDSSSSVPSSSESEDDELSTAVVDNNNSTLKVIAPAQPIVADPRKANRKRREQEEDEAIDDFDADFDIVENTATSYSSKDETTLTAANSAAKRALHLSQLPIEEAASTWNLPQFLVSNLKADSYEHFFPIQCLVIPDVIESERNAHLRGARDVCCHAPTGSGKTLSFVLPILTALHNESPTMSGGGARGLRRLRALVVLPGRDLAKQVYDVFIRYAKGSQIKIGLAVGGGHKKGDLANERRSLVVETYNEAMQNRRKVGGLFEAASSRLRHSFDPTSLSKALDAYDGTLKDDSGPLVFPDVGGRSAVDILVATPGRLMDHLDTPGFTLQHLKYLVIDEADRLVNQPYQNWVGRVLEASNSSNIFNSAAEHTSLSEYIKSPLKVAKDGNTFIIDPITHRNAGSRSAMPHGDHNTSNEEVGSVDDFRGQYVPLRKMLFSATLTQDPQKLARLGLVNPKHFDANYLKRSCTLNNDEPNAVKTGRYSVPAGLCEKMVECSAEQKPIVLLAMLLDKLNDAGKDESGSASLSIVFTSSVDSTHRLCRLLQLLWEAGGFGKSSAIAEFSSSINAKQRAAVLRRCRSSDQSNRVSVLVCSDGMSRGMDLPYVGRVINYDVPAYAKTYVHRCGRTARAGRTGMAISVLKGGQVSKFNRLRKLIDGGRVERMGIKKHLVKNVIPTYKSCVNALQRIIEAEENEELLPSDSLKVGDWL